MLEMLMNPKKAERKHWEMFFVGLFYATLSYWLVRFIFTQDPVLSKYSGILVITFSVMFSLPFVYYVFKLEEEKTLKIEKAFGLLIEHRRSLYALMWLFLGFVIAFSFWYIAIPSTQSFTAQIETYCMINKPTNYDDCVMQYGLKGERKITAGLSAKDKIINIFGNNINVLIFTIVFSLIFGAGAIFVLAWNASVIAAAIGIYTQFNIAEIPLGLARYMIHGLPEIAAYFIAALAGGIISVSITKHDIRSDRFWNILQDSLNLIIAAVIILFIAALMEVFITPSLF